MALAALTGDSGILNNAESAKGNTNLANAKEQVALAVQGALTKAYAEGTRTISRDTLKKELDNLVGTGKYELSTGDASWIVTVTDTGYNATISSTGKITEGENGGVVGTLPTGSGTTPWLPDNFSQVAGTDLSNGLTITNKTDGTIGNQNYVWIEVPNNIERTITINDTSKTITLTQAETNEEIVEWLEVYVGKGTEQDYSMDEYTNDEWYDSEGNGNGASNSSNLEDAEGCGMTNNTYRETYSKMLNSIKNNGGFWLAQYEAGITPEEEHGVNPTNRTESSLRITNPTSANYAKDQYPYNYLTCSEAQKIANADTVEGKYTSSLPFGIQWCLVCKFLDEKTNLEFNDIKR